ncbi:MAG: lecithin retinol acyltransferase family protein [Gammaproteobacteria bacterium]|uniref:lecithin retinol acyltransferase family protein n=1 Tax=Pseudomaricurvus alcaniphilus TaxID=1166482 RepID=UPI001409E732|nr:lecithin retinol acyltransferase family protein [Pseudomaricurvus alcaniphilus]MBR9911110.1 lecithin retinol acyltransferase family protein [Gammaproteobacteria bacterium]NHN36386.1 lecithin retinol acyltransferase family protein [Pseudomaricurvus alcaniphilus]
MAQGDHVYVNRYGGIYSHHGIDCGDGQIIHFGAPDWRTRRHISQISRDEFARGDEIMVRDYSRFFATLESETGRKRDPLQTASVELNKFWDGVRGLAVADIDHSSAAVITRAKSRLGEKNFNLLFNNCEHFASWCVTGISNSDQITGIWRAALPAAQFMQFNARSRLTDWMDHTPFGR